MTGHNAFDQMVTATTTTPVRFLNHIHKEDYRKWQEDYTFLALKGQRYGQSFCNTFGISDNLLYYTTWPAEQVDEYIKKHYLERT